MMGIQQQTALLTHVHGLVANIQTARGGWHTCLDRLKKATTLYDDPFNLT